MSVLRRLPERDDAIAAAYGDDNRSPRTLAHEHGVTVDHVYAVLRERGLAPVDAADALRDLIRLADGSLVRSEIVA